MLVVVDCHGNRLTMIFVFVNEALTFFDIDNELIISITSIDKCIDEGPRQVGSRGIDRGRGTCTQGSQSASTATVDDQISTYGQFRDDFYRYPPSSWVR